MVFVFVKKDIIFKVSKENVFSVLRIVNLVSLKKFVLFVKGKNEINI
jgi:hypothetical protein